MAYALRKNIITGEPEIAISGFSEGIADSPHLGLANMVNINNDSQPGIALCNHKLVTLTSEPITNRAFTGDSGTNKISFTGTEPGAYRAITVSGASLPAGLTAGVIYYTGAAGSPLSLYSDPYLNNVVTMTGNGSGTFSTINMGTPTNWTSYTARTGIYYILDSNGRVWSNDISGSSSLFVLLSGNTLTNSNGNGIEIYKDYLFVFRNAKIDVYGSLAASASSRTWTNDWKTMNTANGTNNSHFAKVGEDDILYWCDAFYLGSLAQTTGNTFDPATAGSYTLTTKALTLPSFEITQCLEEQLTNLVIGTLTSNYLYSWDRTSTSFTIPIPMPEIGTYQLLNINKIVYILSGKRGNVYYTNGSSVTLLKSLPKYSTGTPYPIITWGDMMSLNNNVCFGVGTSSTASGVYAIQLAVGQLGQTIAGAIRHKGSVSAGNYNGNVLIPTNDGLTYYVAWYNGTYGGIDILDTATPTFYSNYESYIETDIIPVGTALQPKTFNRVEFKLDTPMVSGEKIRISMRNDLSTSYTVVFENTTVGAIDGDGPITTQGCKWVQFKIELQTISGSTRSYVRLRELILR